MASGSRPARTPAEVPAGEWQTRLEPAWLDLPRLAQTHGLAAIWVYGSVLREDFGPESDIDLAVDFSPDVVPRFVALQALELELSALLDRPVHVVRRRVIEQSDNPGFRTHVLRRLKSWYVAG